MTGPIAIVKVRKEPHYRREAIESGLLRCGYALHTRWPHLIGKKDLLVIWNRKRGLEETEAEDWERRGGTVIVMENGYLQKVDKTMYAISVGQHNGAGWFPVGTEARFSKLGFEVKPWRTGGEYVLVCAQRGIGSKLMASPAGWERRTAAAIQKIRSGLPVRIRQHPGNFAPKVPLVDDLRYAQSCFIWSSGSGVRALVEGVEVNYSAPRWICERAAVSWKGRPGGEYAIDDVFRMEALHRMSHGQWSVPEIASGEPFARILEGL
jgi:hypothetical protein